MPLHRELMEDASELFALEPFGGRIEQVQICRVGVGWFIVLAIVGRTKVERHGDRAMVGGRPAARS
jgi:hypothetical protein